MSPVLREIPENPIPEGAVVGYMTAFDGRQIRYACFRAGGKNGTVVLLPGRNECIEKYFETVGDLAMAGFNSVALDWRGQGGSERLLKDPRRGYVENFQDYVADLDQFFREVVLPDCRPPYTVFAHSTGGLIALLAAPNLANRVRRMVLTAPLLEVRTQLPGSFVNGLAHVLYALGLGKIYYGGRGRRGKEAPLGSGRLTSDPVRFARNQALVSAFPELFIGGATVAWYRAASLAMTQVRDPDFAAKIRVPILFLAAGADQVVSTPAIERYGRTLRSARVLTIDGARHELLQEADLYREQALAAFMAFATAKEQSAVSEGLPLMDAGGGV